MVSHYFNNAYTVLQSMYFSVHNGLVTMYADHL